MKRHFHQFIFWAPVLAILALFTVPAPARAGIPDLRGSWSVRDQAFSAQRDCDGCGAKLKVSYRIERQHGRVFEGMRISESGSETVMGTIGADNASIYAVDDHGVIQGRILSPSEIEVHRQDLLPDPSAVESSVLLRQ